VGLGKYLMPWALDLDHLLIVQPGRFWSVFFLLEYPGKMEMAGIEI
jgi:hypothetical protein